MLVTEHGGRSMAYIEKRRRKDGQLIYRAQVRIKGFPQQTATFLRVTDAKRWAQTTESAIRERRHFKTTEAKRHTVAELVERYCREALPQKRATTAAKQRQQLTWWRDEIGSYALSEVTPALLNECRQRLIASSALRGGHTRKDGAAATKSASTVNRYLAAFSHALTVAVREWEWLEDNPMRRVGKLRESGRIRFLSLDERIQLLEACKLSASPDLYDAVVLALATGARQSELLTLRWRQVDLQNRRLTLELTKNGRQRSPHLPELAFEVMQRRSRVRRIDTDLVFPGKAARDPKPISVRSAFEVALKRAGIGDFRWHDLRHTFASVMAMSGATLAEIAEALGHSDIKMTMRYAHLCRTHTAKVIDRAIDSMFAEVVS